MAIFEKGETNLMNKREQLREIIKYQIEAYGGKINPKDDFNGFILDILALFPEPSVEEIEKIIFNEISGANFMADINMCKRLVRALSKFRIKREVD